MMPGTTAKGKCNQLFRTKVKWRVGILGFEMHYTKWVMPCAGKLFKKNNVL